MEREQIRELNFWKASAVMPSIIAPEAALQFEVNSYAAEKGTYHTELLREMLSYCIQDVGDETHQSLSWDEIRSKLNVDQSKSRDTETIHEYNARIKQYGVKFVQLMMSRHDIPHGNELAWELLEGAAATEAKLTLEQIRSKLALGSHDEELLSNLLMQRIVRLNPNKVDANEAFRIADHQQRNIRRLLAATDMQQEVKSAFSSWEMLCGAFNNNISTKQALELWTVFVNTDAGRTAVISRRKANGTLSEFERKLLHYGFWNESDSLQEDALLIAHDRKTGKVVQVAHSLTELRHIDHENCVVLPYDIPVRHITQYSTEGSREIKVRFLGRTKTYSSMIEKMAYKEGETPDDINGVMFVVEDYADIPAVWQAVIDTLILSGCKNIHMSRKSEGGGLTQTAIKEGFKLEGNYVYDGPPTDGKAIGREEWPVPYTSNNHNPASSGERVTVQDDINYTDEHGIERTIEIQSYIVGDFVNKGKWMKIADEPYKAGKLESPRRTDSLSLRESMLPDVYLFSIATEVLGFTHTDAVEIIEVLKSDEYRAALKEGAYRRISVG